eukprot:2126804-Pyramimonas_sp.AAC.1
MTHQRRQRGDDEEDEGSSQARNGELSVVFTRTQASADIELRTAGRLSSPLRQSCTNEACERSSKLRR